MGATISVGDLGVELCRVGENLAGTQGRLVRLAAEFAVSDIWRRDASPTAAHWIAAALDVEVCTAREWIRIGRALEALAAIDSAFAAGELSYAKVRQLTRVATTENEAELIDLARTVPAGRLAHVVARHLAAQETPEETEERHHAVRGLTWRTEPDGMICGSFRLPPALAAPLVAAVDTRVMRTRPVTPRR